MSEPAPQHERERLYSLLHDMGVPDPDAHFEAFGFDPEPAS